LTPFTDSGLYEIECQLIALIAGGFLVGMVVMKLKRSRPGLAIGKVVAAAYGLRIIAAYGLEQTPIARELRGGDEVIFLTKAQTIATHSVGSQESMDALTKEFHTFLISLHYRALDSVPEMMIRFEFIALAVVGLALMATAVYELAGPRPAVIAAWLLALEPTSIFFSGLIHKEPLMFLCEGMVAFGGAVLWKRGDLRALAPMVVGCLIATATRPYVGWFLAAAAAVVALHASLRRGSASRSLMLSAVILALMAAFVPAVWKATSYQKLQELQVSQDANSNDKANLALEQVDYSSRGKVLVNLPTRIRDVIFKPYPWQVANTSQQLGVIGTLVMSVGLLLLIGALLQNGGAVMSRAGPLVYPAVFLLVAYSLSAGNAGTAFRYRSHVVALLLCVLLVLRQQRSEAHGRVGGTTGYRTLAPLPKRGVAT
jgi:hypothetical protein